MVVNIFLASSSELKEDRGSFQKFIGQLNIDWHERDIFFKLNLWEDFIDSMSRIGLQEEYNKVVRQCDISLMLFFTKVSKYTAQEFETAFNQAQIDNKPLIYTYFKEDYIHTRLINEEIVSMVEFKKKLGELKHFYSVYTSIEDLEWKFSRQIEKMYGKPNISHLKNPAIIDSLAIERVCKLLSPQSDISLLEHLNLRELINKSSPFGKNAIFQLAKVNRRSNRVINRSLMARSIPVFEALVDSDKRQDYHYYFGQLAYALKDQEDPNWGKAVDNFNTAIEIRGNSEPEYFYELNRAICKVVLDANVYHSRVSDTALQELVIQDLQYAKKGIGNQFEQLFYSDKDNKVLLKWLTINNIHFQDL